MVKNDVKGMAERMKNELYAGLMDKYENIAYGVFDWKGIPQEVPTKYPEKWLFNNGLCTMFVPKGMDAPVCLQVATASIKKNLYGEPTEWRATAPVSIEGVTDVVLDKRNAVLIRNSETYKASRPYVDVLVRQMVNTEMTLRMNMNAQKMPFLFESSNGMKAMQNKNDFVDMMECEPCFIKSDMGGESFKVWQSGAKFIGGDLLTINEEYENRILSYIGAYECSANGMKKERLISAEADNTDALLDVSLSGRLKQRQVACEQFNELFGYDVTVDLAMRKFKEEVIGEDGETNDNEETETSGADAE